jgi:hypothetical protein
VGILCGAKVCPTFVNGELIYFDSNHMRRNLRPETVAELSRRLGISRYFDALDVPSNRRPGGLATGSRAPH